MLSWVIAVAMLGAVLAGPMMKTDEQTIQDFLTTDEFTRNSAMEQLMLDMLEGFRETMINGGEDTPVLDPLNLEAINIDGETLGFEGSHLTMSQVVAEHLSAFVVHDLTMTLTNLILQRYNIAFDVSIPSIDIETSEYDLLLNAMGANIFGNGEATFKLVEPRLSGSITARLRISIIGGAGVSLDVESANIKVGLEGFVPNFRGMLGNENSSDFVNSFLEHLVPELVRFYEDEISAYVNSIVPDLVNNALGRQHMRLM